MNSIIATHFKHAKPASHKMCRVKLRIVAIFDDGGKLDSCFDMLSAALV